MEYGNKAWSKVLKDSYDKFEESGLTQHDNWWPEVYSQACKSWGIEQDQKVAAFDVSYRETRPDQKKTTD
jgi:hypothetical protein